MGKANGIATIEALDRIINDSNDFPLAQLAAMQLKPLLVAAHKMVGVEEEGHAARHAAKQHGLDVPEPVNQTLSIALAQMQEHVLSLRRLTVEHPNQRTEIERQIDNTQNISGTLVSTMAEILEVAQLGRNGGVAGAIGRAG